MDDSSLLFINHQSKFQINLTLICDYALQRQINKLNSMTVQYSIHKAQIIRKLFLDLHISQSRVGRISAF